MYPIFIIGIIAWAIQQGKKAQNEPKRPTGPRGPWPQQRGSASVRPARRVGYVDDGVLSQDEVVALILMLKRYKELDSVAQQEIISLMDARILAQFNHLLNSSWKMDDVALFEYLAQQGRQGRYTELGAFALSVKHGI